MVMGLNYIPSKNIKKKKKMFEKIQNKKTKKSFVVKVRCQNVFGTSKHIKVGLF